MYICFYLFLIFYVQLRLQFKYASRPILDFCNNSTQMGNFSNNVKNILLFTFFFHFDPFLILYHPLLEKLHPHPQVLEEALNIHCVSENEQN